MSIDRFFVDHGMIHDRVTGKHVTTAPDDETWNGGTISDCVALLNDLVAQRDVLQSRITRAEEEVRAAALDGFGYQQLFDAIAAATEPWPKGFGVSISVEAFRNALAAKKD